MGFLRLITIFFFAYSVAAVELSKLIVNCNDLPECGLVEDKFESILNKNINEDQLYAFITNELEKSFYRSLSFAIEENTLVLNVEIKEIVGKIDFETKDTLLKQKLMENFGVKVGDYFDEEVLQNNIYKIQEVFFSNQENSLRYRLEHDEGVSILFRVNSDNIKKIKDIKFSGVSDLYKRDFERFWSTRYQQVWDKISFKKDVDNFKSHLISLGFWHVKIEDSVIPQGNSVRLVLEVALGKRYGFSFFGNNYFDHNTLIREIKKSTHGIEGVSADAISQILSNLYKSRGVFYSSFEVRSTQGQDSDGQFHFYFVNIAEGKKVRIEELNFLGAQSLLIKDLRDVYEKHTSDLLKNKYLDIDTLNIIAARLREYSISQGFIYAKVDEPYISFSEDGKSSFVTYKIVENDRYRVGAVNIKGVDDEALVAEIKTKISNQARQNFNVLEVDNDLKKALDVLKRAGYFFSSYEEKNPKKIVRADASNRLVDINLFFSTGKKSYLGDILVTGNQVTKDIVIKRELRKKKGEVVTPEMINDFVNRLRGLGLFSTVDISPFVGKNIDKESISLNFIVKVREKAFGRGEVAPGYRTDLGTKISFATTYNNWNGMNRSWLTKVQANYRTSLSDLDKERQEKDEKLLEGIVQLQYVEPYLFSTFFTNPLEFRTTVKYQRKRYNSFDADIFSFAPSFNKMLSEKIQFNLSYEFDVIRQFDATLDIDNDTYQIGAITPSITFDYRDNATAPKSGFWVNFTWEFANPYFLSQKDEDLTINYNRALLRTFFYVPVWKFTLATSVTLGAETNFADEKIYNKDGTPKINEETQDQETRGYIPSLKVFRLSGLDFLRGFSDRESNRLIDGTDVSDVIVRKSAYLINLKLEMRYYFDDTTALAVFGDAGRVFVEKVEELDLRTSAGISFKFLTPVGSLDFDYGVKLRREYINEDREKFGRFHLTIGQF